VNLEINPNDNFDGSTSLVQPVKRKLENYFPFIKTKSIEVIISLLVALDGFPPISFITWTELRKFYVNQGIIYWIQTTVKNIAMKYGKME
jgi:hypothetical protein